MAFLAMGLYPLSSHSAVKRKGASSRSLQGTAGNCEAPVHRTCKRQRPATCVALDRGVGTVSNMGSVIEGKSRLKLYIGLDALSQILYYTEECDLPLLATRASWNAKKVVIAEMGTASDYGFGLCQRVQLTFSDMTSCHISRQLRHGTYGYNSPLKHFNEKTWSLPHSQILGPSIIPVFSRADKGVAEPLSLQLIPRRRIIRRGLNISQETIPAIRAYRHR